MGEVQWEVEPAGVQEPLLLKGGGLLGGTGVGVFFVFFFLKNFRGLPPPPPPHSLRGSWVSGNLPKQLVSEKNDG